MSLKWPWYFAAESSWVQGRTKKMLQGLMGKLKVQMRMKRFTEWEPYHQGK
jgi:hypothetical protein